MAGPKDVITKVGLRKYATFVAALKYRIHSAQVQATRTVYRELIKLYWDIGKAIVERRKLGLSKQELR